MDAVPDDGVRGNSKLSFGHFRHLAGLFVSVMDPLDRWRAVPVVVSLGLSGDDRQRGTKCQSGDYRLPHVRILLRGASRGPHGLG